MSKKMSIVTNLSKDEMSIVGISGPNTHDLNATNLDANEMRMAKLTSDFQKLEFNKISNHFVFGNQNSSATDALMNKTSNNKLDQSLRVSYVEMCDILKTYKPFDNNAIELLNESYENKCFTEWIRQMKSAIFYFFFGVVKLG